MEDKISKNEEIIELQKELDIVKYRLKSVKSLMDRVVLRLEQQGIDIGFTEEDIQEITEENPGKTDYRKGKEDENKVTIREQVPEPERDKPILIIDATSRNKRKKQEDKYTPSHQREGMKFKINIKETRDWKKRDMRTWIQDRLHGKEESRWRLEATDRHNNITWFSTTNEEDIAKNAKKITYEEESLAGRYRPAIGRKM
ncbi:hypothetical protein QAD02_014003 [Eretmocerus hayati]|uniref:Uncharacterized protein n=1 Tax=Eretmocerus hayati TaxID=131215 RepID=A0ACC2P456_9HYME|nr:hypothetical protein QAD02_014003 [Eretmocerus hayati]